MSKHCLRCGVSRNMQHEIRCGAFGTWFDAHIWEESVSKPRLTKNVRDALSEIAYLAQADIDADQDRWSKAEHEAFQAAFVWLAHHYNTQDKE